jgi:CubicO group peptidase (beta-lactamase class C family)
MTTTVQGFVAPGFEELADTFEQTNRNSPGGSALSVLISGEPVVDLWAGTANPYTSSAWEADTPTVVFSCTKGIMSLLIGRLVQDGRLELDAPVSAYWPEFGANGKEAVTVRELLAHRAGLAAPQQDITLDTALDWQAVTAELAGQKPLWEPGTKYGYHALTFGWLSGELIRRVTGLTVSQYLHDAMTGPLGADFWIGVPDDVAPRVARLIASDTLGQAAPDPSLIDPADAYWMERAMTLGSAFPAALVKPGEGFDDQRVQKAEIPGAGGIATAKALATIWSAAVTTTNGTRLLDDVVARDMTSVQSEGAPVWWLPGPYPRWGTGFMLTSERRRFLTPGSFGHDGAGGQVAFASPEHELGFAYTTNVLQGQEDNRGTSLVETLAATMAGNGGSAL